MRWANTGRPPWQGWDLQFRPRMQGCKQGHLGPENASRKDRSTPVRVCSVALRCCPQRDRIPVPETHGLSAVRDVTQLADCATGTRAMHPGTDPSDSRCLLGVRRPPTVFVSGTGKSCAECMAPRQPKDARGVVTGSVRTCKSVRAGFPWAVTDRRGRRGQGSTATPPQWVFPVGSVAGSSFTGRPSALRHRGFSRSTVRTSGQAPRPVTGLLRAEPPPPPGGGHSRTGRSPSGPRGCRPAP